MAQVRGRRLAKAVKAVFCGHEVARMEWDEVVRELEKLARKLAVEVRYAPTNGRVGRCLLRGTPVIVLDSNLRLRDRAEGLALMLADFDTEAHYLPEMVREFLAKRRGVYDNLRFEL